MKITYKWIYVYDFDLLTYRGKGGFLEDWNKEGRQV